MLYGRVDSMYTLISGTGNNTARNRSSTRRASGGSLYCRGWGEPEGLTTTFRLFALHFAGSTATMQVWRTINALTV